MSHSSSPNNRNSIFGWVKNLKNKNLLSNESVNEISDNDIMSSSDYKYSDAENIPSSNQNSYNQEFLRPSLNHKSRSANNVNRVRSHSQSDNNSAINHFGNTPNPNASIRQHRDSFLLSNPLVDKNSKYFGVPLEEAVNQACAKISIFAENDSGEVLQYGRIPVVVAKCGVFLKTNGLSVEGIFRVGGSSKRLKELQVLFNTPPDFGKKLNWDGYTVHDAASILRRYLNSLPEPLIPLELYEIFRAPLRSRARIINYMKYKASNPKKLLKSKMSPTLVEAADTPVEAFKLNEFNSNVTSNVTQTPKTVDTSNSLPSPSLSPDNYHDEVMGGSISLDNRMDTIESVGKHEVFGDNDEENDADNDDDDNDHNNVNSDNENVNYVDNDGLVKRNEEMVKMKQSKKNKHYKKLTKDVHDAIDEYKVMLDQLPILSKQLLFYILDLLAMVQNHSSENLMSSRNLAAIFQPSILSHPNHDLDPTEYALSQFVVEFLIQYAYKLLPNHDNLSRPISKSPVSTTSVNKLEGDKHKLAPRFNRQHSKSLSSANHEDVVGYQNKVSNSKLPVVDKDYEIAEDDSDHEEKEKFKEREPSSQPAIIVSTPSSSSVPKV